MYRLSFICTEKRDVYLAFKTLNVLETGALTEEEFMDVYSVIKLNWKVTKDAVCNRSSNMGGGVA